MMHIKESQWKRSTFERLMVGGGEVFGMGAFWQSYLLEKDGQCPFCWELQSIIITAALLRCQFILRYCQRSDFHKMHHLLILQRLSCNRQAVTASKIQQAVWYWQAGMSILYTWACCFWTLMAILQSWEKSMQDWFYHWETPKFGPDSSPRPSGLVWWFIHPSIIRGILRSDLIKIPYKLKLFYSITLVGLLGG